MQLQRTCAYHLLAFKQENNLSNKGVWLSHIFQNMPNLRRGFAHPNWPFRSGSLFTTKETFSLHFTSSRWVCRYPFPAAMWLGWLGIQAMRKKQKNFRLWIFSSWDVEWVVESHGFKAGTCWHHQVIFCASGISMVVLLGRWLGSFWAEQHWKIGQSLGPSELRGALLNVFWNPGSGSTCIAFNLEGSDHDQYACLFAYYLRCWSDWLGQQEICKSQKRKKDQRIPRVGCFFLGVIKWYQVLST